MVFRFKTKVERFIIVNCTLVRVYLNNNVVAISKQFTSTVSQISGKDLSVITFTHCIKAILLVYQRSKNVDLASEDVRPDGLISSVHFIDCEGEKSKSSCSFEIIHNLYSCFVS